MSVESVTRACISSVSGIVASAYAGCYEIVVDPDLVTLRFMSISNR